MVALEGFEDVCVGSAVVPGRECLVPGKWRVVRHP